MDEIERALVGWFETSGYRVEHDEGWFALVGGEWLDLSEIAIAIAAAKSRGAD